MACKVAPQHRGVDPCPSRTVSISELGQSHEEIAGLCQAVRDGLESSDAAGSSRGHVALELDSLNEQREEHLPGAHFGIRVRCVLTQDFADDPLEMLQSLANACVRGPWRIHRLSERGCVRMRSRQFSKDGGLACASVRRGDDKAEPPCSGLRAVPVVGDRLEHRAGQLSELLVRRRHRRLASHGDGDLSRHRMRAFDNPSHNEVVDRTLASRLEGDLVDQNRVADQVNRRARQ